VPVCSRSENAQYGKIPIQITFPPRQVYAVGLYIDSKSAKRVLGSLKGLDAAKYSQASYELLINSDELPKALRLVMLRSVSGEQMGGAIGEAVESRLKSMKLSAPERSAADSAFKEFRAQFNMPELATGTELSFAMQRGGVLGVSIAGKESKTITSKHLCTAFLDVFLGSSAVLNRALLVTRIPSLLA
jgi:hypothetical protein